jgi:hypothetical protein
LDGNIAPLAEKLLKYHKNKSLRQFRDYTEAAFQTAVELQIPFENWISEMRLFSNKNDKNEYLFVDVFVSGEIDGRKSNVVLELKSISLTGLYYGKNRKRTSGIDFNSLIDLDNQIKVESEDAIFDMDYCFWDKQNKVYQFTTVRKIFDAAMNQIHRYKNLLKKGQVSHNTVTVEVGSGKLGGWIVISVGTSRIITRKIEFQIINYNFILRS